MAKLIAKIVIDLDEYNQLKFAASKLAESEKIIKEHLKIKPEETTKLDEPQEDIASNSDNDKEVNKKQQKLTFLLLLTW